MTGASDGSVGVWTPSGECCHMMPRCHGAAVRLAAACGPGGGVVTAAADGTVVRWQWPRRGLAAAEGGGASAPQPAPPFVGAHRSEPRGLVHTLALDAGSRVVLLGGEQGAVHAWQADS